MTEVGEDGGARNLAWPCFFMSPSAVPTTSAIRELTCELRVCLITSRRGSISAQAQPRIFKYLRTLSHGGFRFSRSRSARTVGQRVKMADEQTFGSISLFAGGISSQGALRLGADKVEWKKAGGGRSVSIA